MYNWLINPVQKTDVDSDNTNLWKSRDIDATETVFVSPPESVYYNKLSFQSWKISNSVELPLYLVKKGEKNFRVDYKRVVVCGEELRLCVVRTGFYNYDIGVDFYENDKDDIYL